LRSIQPFFTFVATANYVASYVLSSRAFEYTFKSLIPQADGWALRRRSVRASPVVPTMNASFLSLPNLCFMALVASLPAGSLSSPSVTLEKQAFRH
jgi:hypothetical protein